MDWKKSCVAYRREVIGNAIEWVNQMKVYALKKGGEAEKFV